MAKKIRIGVIFGGRSGEHEVSIASAESVIKALDEKKYEVVPIGITKQGTWLTQNNPLKILKKGSFKAADTLKIITPDSTKKSLVAIKGAKGITKPITEKKLDVVFPVLHGTFGEDGTIQGLLELADIPYIGANVLASAVGMDKTIQKIIFKNSGLPVVPFVFFTKYEFKNNKIFVFKKISGLGYPIFIKPANLGSSVGISKVKNFNELNEAINLAFLYDKKIIAEKAVLKPREIEIAVLGNDNPSASLPGEVFASNEFYDYDAKYVDGKSQINIPADLPKDLSSKLRKYAINAFKSIDCSGMARVDFLLGNQNKIYLSEVNTIPGFTSISMYPKLWQATGLSYDKLIEKLITLAIEKHREKSDLSTSYKPKARWYQK
ncbi:MAG: D-alanine--D-alanine ligase family protein [Patescibacteria group bacterium]|jgi:D-alanine-D-alanine ligase